MDVASQLRALIAEAITRRLREEVVEEILPKPTIDQLEEMIKEAEKTGAAMPTLMPSGELMVTRKTPIFARDLADAVLWALHEAGFKVVGNQEKEEVE